MKPSTVKKLREFLKGKYLSVRKLLLTPLLLLKRTVNILPGDIREILFLRHDGVGDMVLSTPAFKALKIKYPESRLTVLASMRNHEIIQNNPYIDEVLIYKGDRWFINEIRRRDFDMVIDPFITYELSHAFVAYLSRAKYRIGFEKAGREIFFNVKCPSVSYDKRMIEAVLDLVEAAGCVSDECEPEIFLTEGEKSRALKTLAERGLDKLLKVAIHPGALYPIRMWPIERFGEVARRLTDEFGIKVLVFGGSLEKSLLDKMHDLAGDGIEMFYHLKLRQFISLLSCCNLLLCNNSGPLHIASALKIPTVSMVGPSFIPLWLPWGDNHITIRKDVPCSPCNRAECEDHSCMNLITVEEVMDAVRKQLRIIQ